MKIRAIGVGAMLVIGVAGCSSSKAADGAAGAGKDDVTIKMSEWLLEPSVTSLKAGELVIEVNNVGGQEHELIVLAGADAKAFAVKADGSVDEDAIDEAAKMGEVEKVGGGTAKSGTFNLKAGTYVLMCNLVDKAANAHYAKGMVSMITVA
jgi:plastocyanin